MPPDMREALAFLTPLPGARRPSSRALPWFPVVGAAIGLAMVSFVIGAFMLLAKTKKHCVGTTWLDAATAEKPESKGGVVFKVGKGEYRGF